MSAKRRPSKMGEWLFRLLNGSPHRDAILGDIYERFGQGRSHLWYWTEIIVALIAGAGGLPGRFFSSCGGLMLKDCRFGLWMGACFAPWIVLSQAVFPSNRSDDEFGGLILSVYLATFVYYGAAGVFSVRKSNRIRDGLRVGAVTAVIGMGLITAVFTLVDNIFLETVSQQVDKIRGFQLHQSQYPSMRAYINWSMLEGAAFGLPVFGLIGAACGGLGGILAKNTGVYATRSTSSVQ